MMTDIDAYARATGALTALLDGVLIQAKNGTLDAYQIKLFERRAKEVEQARLDAIFGANYEREQVATQHAIELGVES
jgi:hypothetical protein